MRSPPPDLAPQRVRDALADGWALDLASIEYVPEGGGSHHWKVVDRDGNARFVTVDDLDEKPWIGATREVTYEGLRRAMGTAAGLRHGAHLDFVVAPTATHDGELLRRLDDRYAISVFPFLTGTSYPFGPHRDPALRRAALDLLVALHDATPVVEQQAPSHEPGFGGRTDLERLLARPGRPWEAGPYSAVAQAVLSARFAELAQLVASFDRLVEATAGSRRATVVTHGEPHPANLMSAGGRLMLIDWDTVALAPPERDLSLVAADHRADLERYEQATGRRVDQMVVTLYRCRWYLDDLASAARMFSRPHDDTDDTRRWAEALPGRLDELPSWLAMLP